MKNTVLFIDDDFTLLDSVVPNLRVHFGAQGIRIKELQSAEEVSHFVSRPGDSKPVLAIVDLWLNDFSSNTSDQNGGFKIIGKLRQVYPGIPIIVYSAHLNPERSRKIKEAFPKVPILSKGDGGIDGLVATIDEALRTRDNS